MKVWYCLRKYYVNSFQKIDLSYIPQNVNPLNSKNKIDLLKAEVGDHIFDKLILNNQLDLKLLDLVKNEFNIRLNNIHNFQDKLLSFKSRCRSRLNS